MFCAQKKAGYYSTGVHIIHRAGYYSTGMDIILQGWIFLLKGEYHSTGLILFYRLDKILQGGHFSRGTVILLLDWILFYRVGYYSSRRKITLWGGETFYNWSFTCLIYSTDLDTFLQGSLLVVRNWKCLVSKQALDFSSKCLISKFSCYQSNVHPRECVRVSPKKPGWARGSVWSYANSDNLIVGNI